MGKKSTIKRLRRIANELTSLQQQSTAKEIVTGDKLIEAGVQTINKGTSKEILVMKNETYEKRNVQIVDVNHSRRIRKMFKRFGDAGVKAYVDSVNAFVEKEKLKTA